MRRIERSALMPYSADAMFAVVNDVVSYPRFLPWCEGSEVITQTPDELVARLDLAGAGIKRSFTTRNVLCRPQSIEVSLLEGPFSRLDGSWCFTELGEDASKVEMVLAFDFDNKLLSRALARVFDAAADKMVDAFCSRADQLYS